MSDPKYDNWFTDADQLGKPKTEVTTPSSGGLDQAKAIIQAFYNRNGNSPYFTQLNRYAVAKDVMDRLSKPDSFNQGNTWLCGIATFVRVWAMDAPAQYAQLAVDLFEKGKGTLAGSKKHDGRAIEPSQELRTSPAGSGVSPGDWIILASIRESFNDVFDYSADEGIFRIKSWNFPSDVEGEFKASGYSKVRNNAGLSRGGINTLDEASDLFDAGWRVILLVHSDIISSTTPLTGQIFRTSNHWVGLKSTVDVTRWGPEWKVNPFDVYSWNGPRRIPGWKAPVPLGVFNSYFFGYVAGLY
jgi:hypothetical protein